MRQGGDWQCSGVEREYFRMCPNGYGERLPRRVAQSHASGAAATWTALDRLAIQQGNPIQQREEVAAELDLHGDFDEFAIDP